MCVSDIASVTAMIVSRLKAEGILKRGEDGKFDRDEATRAYCRHLRKAASGRAGAELTAAAKTKSLEASARLKAAQTKAAELRLKQQNGELMLFSDHESLLTSVFRLFRGQMLSLVPRISSTLNLNVADSDKVQGVVYQSMRDLATCDPLKALNLEVVDD